jgi:5-methylcytosine-specific restriction endonuclease McrA
MRTKFTRAKAPAISGWAKKKLAVHTRDRHRCRICGDDDILHVHHVDWNRKHNEDTNLVTLCSGCHTAIHREGYKPDDHWEWPAPWGELKACCEDDW